MFDFKWYWNRLRSMSASEVAHRVVEKGRKSAARQDRRGWARFPTGGNLPTIPGFAAAVDSARTTLADDAARAAAYFMDGGFRTLGVEWPRITLDAGAVSVWHLDPVTGQHWPADVYCFDVGYRGSTEMGDVKYVWEFSRLQFLQPVAVHARLAHSEAALAFLTQAIDSWHKSNPPYLGVGWSSGIELSLRAISLLVVTSLVGDRLSQRTRDQVNQILRAHAYWLARYPSRFSSANNHLVAEEAALFLLGVTCTFLPDAARMGEAARTAIERETTLQILADGVAAEQSPTYGALTSELILLCAWVAAGLGAPMSTQVMDRLGAFADWVNWLAETDGRVPAIGDDDEGRVLTLGLEEPGYATSVAAAIASFVERPDLVPPYAPTLRNALVAPKVASDRPQGTRSFRTGGYTVHRAPIAGHMTTLVIDHAPLGYLAIAAHGHADALSFTLAVDGRPVFVDPGTYLYHSGHEWRDWFRNTRAHNTVAVEGAEQSVISGAFNWSHKAQAQLDRVGDVPFVLEASHDGYTGRFGVRHHRRFALKDAVLVIQDALVGVAERTAEIVLQLAPDCDVGEKNGAMIVRRGDARLATVTFPPNGVVATSRGAGMLDGGWVSPHFGAKTPATRLSWKGQIGEAGVTTLIVIG